MSLELVREFLKSQPKYSETAGNQIMLDCPFCGGHKHRVTTEGSMSIKMPTEIGDPILYHCFRAECGASGMLKPKDLELMNCHDPETLLELDNYNRSVQGKPSKGFVAKSKRNYELVNPDTKYNQSKLAYINHRLGTNFSTGDLRNLKIQLGLYDFLNINNIHALAYNKSYCDILDAYTIGFMSMYNDYLICRDVSKSQKTGKRYTMYRTSGKPADTDMKLYCIPTEIDLLDPDPACINIAEGAFSILGAYLHSGLGFDYKNSIWLANCGSEYKNTLNHVIKQYGLLDVCLHIWSDSEVGVSKYEKLLKEMKGHVHFTAVYVHYNSKAEDFGHASDDIKVETIKLK